MSIEDVDFMKKYSIKENYTFIIDSRFRNQDEYPEPNNYVINFDIPFKNVFGIEILDVTIPKTMYNVDTDINNFILYINTTKQPINDYYNNAKGLDWIIKNYNENDIEIINYLLADKLKTNEVSGLEWKLIENIPDNFIEINNNELSNILKNKNILTENEYNSLNINKLYKNNYIKIDNNIYVPKNIFNINDWLSFNITNLAINNYIKVVNPLKWINIQNNITNNNINIFNINFSKKLSNNNNNSDIIIDNIDEYFIDNLRNYNIIPVFDYTTNFHLNWYCIGNEFNFKPYKLKWINIGNKIIKDGIEIFNDNLKNILNYKNILSQEEYDSLNITNIDNNNFINVNNSYYKAYDNYNIGLNWILYSNLNIPTTGNEYINDNLTYSIRNKYINKKIELLQLNDNITNPIIIYNNYEELNNLDYNFNINIEDYIKVNIGNRWINAGVISLNNFNLNNQLTKNNFNPIDTTITNEDAFRLFKSDFNNLKNDIEIDIIKLNNYNIQNFNNNNFVIIDDNIWIIEPSYFKPNGLWIQNNNLANLLDEKHNQFGLEWEYIGENKPTFGYEIINNQLSNYLNQQNNILLTTDIFDTLNINNLKYDNFIIGYDNISYYKPKNILLSLDEFEKTKINKDDLNVENFIKSNNNLYFKIVPTYYYTPENLFYYPNDLYNINNSNDYTDFLDNFFEKFEFKLPIGNYNINKLILAINNEFSKINLDIKNRITFPNKINNNDNRFLTNNEQFELLLKCSGNSVPADLTNILKFECSRLIIFDMNNSTCNETLGFYSKVSDDNYFIQENFFKRLSINNSITYQNFYHSIYNNINNNFTIISPGIVYLIGSKYILLRCPEIEQHLYGSLSYTKNTIGLAKIRTSHWGLNEESNPLFKLKLREFHPIGKLDKITLRFENADGSLYNFRGVNHDLVFAIHYYTPKQNKSFDKSIANPEYKMDFMQYKYTQEEQESDNDSDNDNNYSRIDLDNYKKMELKYSNKIYNNNYEVDYNKIRNNSDLLNNVNYINNNSCTDNSSDSDI